ncbi:YraN family protein [Amycolatopsis sp. GM8]|uniref:YraN family protein n=1 Tax=Amycolatopsis sp. GM8 TaxID=2896530 RepID=UPI001EFF689B|nr:YraN family protein [Amycolatopsis sp. GM8]
MTDTVARPEAAHLALGRRGEEQAAQHLESLGLVVLDRNWRCREGELDIVATDYRSVIVCEVKTRAGLDFGDPGEAVTGEKIARIRRITSHWLRDRRVPWCPIRFDVVSVLVSPGGELQLKHFPAAF